MDKTIIYSRIEKDVSKLESPAIIGINGAVTSGKTIFAHELNQHFQNTGYQTQVIHIDDFHNPRSIRMRENSPECYFDNALDTQKFSELILEIKCGPVNKTMALLNMGTDTYNDTKTFITDMDTIVIVEGVLLYCQSLSHLFDYKVFLDINYEEVLRRGNERDVPLYGDAILQQYVDLYIPVQKIYESRCSPKEQSDLVVINNDYSKPIIIERTL